MMKRASIALLLIGLPLVLGSLASVLMQGLFNPLPVIVFTADLSMLAFLSGVFVTLLAAAFYVGASVRDRQARRRLDGALQAAEQSRRRFLHRLDHEIKNPLTGLRAALTNISEARSPMERENAARNARNAAERLSSLLVDLRKLSDLGERPLEMLPVDIPQLLEEMVDAARAQPDYGDRRINLMVTRVPWQLPAVRGDRDLLGLAIYNIIHNALKFTGAEDSIEIRAFEDGRAIIIEVADTGPGIAPEDLGSIFEELYRGANARGVDGSGLGLALAHRIVDLHGGWIAVRSRQTEPRGTVLTIRIPISRS